MASNNLAERILDFVRAKGYQPHKVQELARAMGIGEDEHGDFRSACKALMKTGRIVLGAGHALTLPGPPGKLQGTFRANPRGFGFVIPDTPNSHGDLYVPKGGTGGAVTGDTVFATVRKRGKRGGKMLYEGRIVEILKRGRSHFVGELRRQFNRWYMFPDGNTLHVPVVVDDPGAKNAGAGDQVVVEITQYPDGSTGARGVIIRVLGPRGEPAVDVLSIIEQYQLPHEFPKTVVQEARDVSAEFNPQTAYEGREDLRSQTVITIDPTDARDFDDAISIAVNKNGTTELGVHIADVAHFVDAGSELDKEAKLRSNSVYLSRTVVPMLPELLSNGVCSLQERQARLTKSVFITFDRRGQVKKARLSNTVIRSTKRLTYEQATRILDGRPGRTSAKVVALLTEMEKLAQTIRKRRLREGMLVLDLPSIELVYDEEGAVVDVEPADTSFSHTIIEMFMIEANEAVARILDKDGVPFLRRIHDEPEEGGSFNLQRFLGVLGYDLPEVADRFAVQKLLDRVKGKPESFAVNLAVLRSMQQAEYSPKQAGHFALASADYCHFTSPIRRYPDLTVHRLVDLHLQGMLKTAKGRRQGLSETALVALGKECSTNERRAEAAERELRLVMILRLLEQRLGDQLEGVVTGVANVGVFVQLNHFLVEGLLRLNDLPDDWWEVDAGQGAVIGELSGHRITIGERLQVIIDKVDLANRQLDLSLAAPLEGDPGKSSKRGSGSRSTRAGRARVVRRKTPRNPAQTKRGKRKRRGR